MKAPNACVVPCLPSEPRHTGCRACVGGVSGTAASPLPFAGFCLSGSRTSWPFPRSAWPYPVRLHPPWVAPFDSRGL